MKAIVIYHSQTGFTEKYAKWIAEETGADCLALPTAKKENLSAYDTIIFGSFAYAGTIRKLGWFKKNLERWADKKLVLFCTGANPADSPEIQSFFKQNFKEPAFQSVRTFYCPGGLNYQKMTAPSKMMMKIFVKMLRSKKDKTSTEENMIKMISESYDISDRKYIDPILEYLR